MKNKAHYLKERVKPGALAQPVKKSCKNCLKGKRLGLTHDVLCREKGIVSADYYCSSHRFFIMEDLKKVEFSHCSECQFFVFHPHPSITAYGVCDMFSVRKCDGSLKKACSKFVKRREHIA